MINPRVLAKGAFGMDDVRIVVCESNQVSSLDIEAHIEHEWNALMRRAQERGKNIWNGNSQRVNALSVQGGVLNLELGVFDFKHRECVHSYPGYYDLPETYWRKGLYCSAFVVTADGWYVFVRLSGKSLNLNTEDCIGGIVGDTAPIETGEQLFEEMFRELLEEVAVPRDSVATITLDLVFLGSTTNVGAHFSILLSDTRQQVEQRFEVSAEDPDIESLVFVSRSDLSRKLMEIGANKAYIGKEMGLCDGE